MDIRQLEYFVAIVDEGSINAAADVLRLGQPALSRQVRALEIEVGVELLVRTPRGVQATPAGEALARHARRLIALRAEIPEVIAHSRAVAEMVNIGIPPGTPAEWLLEVVRLLLTHLACQPVIAESSSTQQLKRLREGRLDLAIVHQEPPKDVRAWLLRSEDFGLAVRPDSPLVERPRLEIDALDGIRVMVHSREQVPTQQDALIAAVVNAGAEPVWQFVQFVEHARAAAEAVRADAALVSRHTATRQLDGWHWRPISGLGVQMRTWLLAPMRSRAIVQDAAAAIVALSA
ncbi:LysR family transcriptional regulator [Microbacterium sp. JZ70]